VTLDEPLRAAQFSGITGPFRRWALGQALARADVIVTPSEDARGNLLRHCPNLRRSAVRIHTIPEGVDSRRSEGAPPRDCLREELGLDAGVVLVGHVGGFTPQAGFPLLIEAVRRLVRFGGVPAFHVIALGTAACRDALADAHAQVAHADLERALTVREATGDLVSVLLQFDLVVVPSLWDAPTAVAMEAMTAGVPVLGSDCLGLRAALRGTPARAFTAGVPAELETALREALARPWRAEAQAYADEARRRFDRGQSARRLAALYDRLLGKPAEE
jgi:glycosyltransferase involved in cell wall biosynthesis